MKKHFNAIIFICYLAILLVPAFVLSVISQNIQQEEPVQVVYEEYTMEPVVVVTQEVINPRDRYLEKLDAINDIEDSLEWFKAYKALNEEFEDYGDIEWIDDVYSEDEIYLLERVVEGECHGANFESKTHVAAVVFARLESERFPNTLTEVIMQPNQFYIVKTSIDEETKLAVEYAFCVATAADDCLWFHSMEKKEKFSGGDYVFSDNCHHFYK